MWLSHLLTLLFVILHLFGEIQSDEEENPFFLNAHKNIPRIGRSSELDKNRNEEFEKFFRKASKSVPRIGRRNEVEKYTNNNVGIGTPLLSPQGMKGEHFKFPTWSNIAEAFEYHPDLLTSPEKMTLLEEQMGDDPSVYEWDKIRIKRTLAQQGEDK